MVIFTVKAHLFGIWLLTIICMYLSLFLWHQSWIFPRRGFVSFGEFVVGPAITVIICWIGGRQMAARLHVKVLVMSWVYACLIAVSFVGILYGACHAVGIL